MDFGVSNVKDVVFYDKEGNEIMRLDRISNISLTYEHSAGARPIINCDLESWSCSWPTAIPIVEEQEEKEEKEKSIFKEIYSNDGSL